MLKGIPPIIQPDLLKILSEMGHGDAIVLADAHFPAESVGVRSHVIRYDGQPIEPLLDAGIGMLERFAFYEEAGRSYCIVATGEQSQYANIIIRKGVIR